MSNLIARADAGEGSSYASVNGLRMYYEIHGSGRPLVLLHGGLSTIDQDFGRMMPAFANTRQLIAIEQQAHGHTGDGDRPLRLDIMAEDTAALLEQLGIGNADFFGYSVGAGIALLLAIRHSELVRKMVLAGGTAYHPSGLYPEAQEAEMSMQPGHLAGTPFQRAYAAVAPNPDDWPVLIEKIKEMDSTWEGVPPEDIRAVRAPALLIIGDSDIVKPEHTMEMFRLLGGGVAGDLAGLPRSQLAVLPGTTHIGLTDHTDWLVSMITSFLDAPIPDGE